MGLSIDGIVAPEAPGEGGAVSMTRRTFGRVAAVSAASAAAGLLASCSGSRGGSGGDGGVMDVDDRQGTGETGIDRQAAQFVSGLTLEQKVAQLFFVTPESLTGIDVATAAGDQTREAYAQLPVGGVVYFGQNLEDQAQTTEMLSSMAQIGVDEIGYPPFLSVDEEGGTVTRVEDNPGFDAPNVGDMRDVGATADASYARQVAETLAGYLLPLGFNTDFAPCCDVANNPESDTMLYRSFGSDPQAVAEMVSAQVQGFSESGILCCAKHFPGIGAAQGDSHDESISSEKTLDELWECELVPFQAAVDAGVPFVMVGHLSLPNVTGDGTPASLSSAAVQDILRDEMGYAGIVVTDSLSMGAVSSYGAQAAVMALQAGCDMPLMPEDLSAAYNAVLAAVSDGTLSEERIDESVTRIIRAKMELA